MGRAGSGSSFSSHSRAGGSSFDSFGGFGGRSCSRGYTSYNRTTVYNNGGYHASLTTEESKEAYANELFD